MTIHQPDQASQPASVRLDERRRFLQLPLAERRRRLAEQADRFVEHYEQEPERAERQDWQAGDISKH